jgi:PAS domain S-box-containing protein
MSADVSPATILIVDDDQGLLRLISKTLQRHNFTVATAASGQQAAAWLERHRPELMLLDLRLKDLQGQELIDRLLSVQSKVPFIIITGQGDERAAVNMMKRGALDYLVKDADFLQFLPEVVQRALAQVAREKRLAEAEEALRRTSAHLARAQEIAHFGSYQIDVPASATSHWSAEIFRILGRDPASKDLAADEYLKTVVHPDDREMVRHALEHALQAITRYDVEYRIIRPDGSIRHVHSLAEPVRGPDGKILRLVGTLQDVTERKQLEKEIREISEREQRRIGRDLHDGLGQQLTAIELMCESLRSDLGSTQPELQKQAGQICRFLREAISQTRSLAHGLAAFKVETDGLQSALMELTQATSSLGRLSCRLDCPDNVTLGDREASIHLYRIAQEAINNAVKHSQADRVVVHLSRRNGRLLLKIADNGKGLPGQTEPAEGMGLHLMKHRAGMIGARLEVQSRAGKGVTVTCTLSRQE